LEQYRVCDRLEVESISTISSTKDIDPSGLICPCNNNYQVFLHLATACQTNVLLLVLLFPQALQNIKF
jgi:hypothetical protein